MKKLHYLLSFLLIHCCSYSNDNFILITSLYHEKNEIRVRELMTCLKHNYAHPDISLIHVLYDVNDSQKDNDPVWRFLQEHKNIIVEEIHGRPSFGQCFSVANDKYSGETVIISNADIFFNKTLGLLKNVDMTNLFLALTRWNVHKDGYLKIYCGRRGVHHPGSHDAWVFQAPITRIQADDVYVGITHCDIYLAYCAMISGFDVYNPCFDIQCCHVHMSNIRHQPRFNRPKPESAHVPWCHLKQVRNKKYQAIIRPR